MICIGKYEVLDCLAERYSHGEIHLEEAVLAQVKHDGLVDKFVNKVGYINDKRVQPCDLDDLKQEGLTGALIALRKFNANHQSHSQYSTYAAYYIKKKVLHALRNMRYTLKLSGRQHDAIARITRVEMRADAKTMTDSEIAKAADVPMSTFKKLRIARNLRVNHVLSLQAPDDAEHGEPQHYNVSARDAVDHVEPIHLLVEEESEQEAYDQAHMLLGTLPEEERTVLELRFGIRDEIPRSLPDIAVMLEVPADKVKKTSERAMKSLKTYVRANHIKKS